MSRYKRSIDSRYEVIYGYDRSAKSFFVQLWDKDFIVDDPDLEAPTKVAGYTPLEASLEPFASDYGPYPLDIRGLGDCLTTWGLPQQQVQFICERASKDPDFLLQ